MRLIDVDELNSEYMEVHNDEYGTFYAVSEEMINSLPTIEPPQGEWVGEYGYYPHCSICGEKVEVMGGTKYCPNCGAKMMNGGIKCQEN